VLRTSKRPEPYKTVHCLSCISTNHRATVSNTGLLQKAPRGATPGARSDPKHRQLARQVGGASPIQASSMVVTFQHKIVLRPGSVFYYGTIVHSRRERNSASHHGSTGEKVFLKNLRGNRSRTGKSATSSAPSKDHFQQARSQSASVLKGERKEARHSGSSILPRRPLHRESGVAPRLRRRTNCARGRTSSAGIPPTKKPTLKYSTTSRGRGAGPGAARIARRGLGDRRNSKGTGLQGKGGIPGDVTVGKLKSRPSRKQGNVEKIHFSDAT
jgi:hypothetical protein